MPVANELGKEFFKLLKRYFPPIKLYKLFNKNRVKLNYNCIANVAKLINKSITKKLKNKQYIKYSRCI